MYYTYTPNTKVYYGKDYTLYINKKEVCHFDKVKIATNVDILKKPWYVKYIEEQEKKTKESKK